MKTIIIPLLLLVLVSCSPKVYDEIIEHRQPSDYDSQILVLDVHDLRPENAILVAKLKTDKNRFESTPLGSYYYEIQMLEYEAKKLGGNILKIVSDTEPDAFCAIHRIEAEVYYSSEPVAVSHPDVAKVFIFRPDTVSTKFPYTLILDEENSYKSVNRSRKSVVVPSDSTLCFKAKERKDFRYEFNVEKGKDYYLLSTVENKDGDFVLKLDMVDEESGKKGWEHNSPRDDYAMIHRGFCVSAQFGMGIRSGNVMQFGLDAGAERGTKSRIGFELGVDFSYFFKDAFGVGAMLSRFTCGDERTEYGKPFPTSLVEKNYSVTNDISLVYVGPTFSYRIKKPYTPFQLSISTGMGYVSYVNDRKVELNKTRYSAGTLGYMLAGRFDYRLLNSVSAGVFVEYLGGTPFAKYKSTKGESSVVLTSTKKESVGRLSAGIGLQYSF
jgi:hypothetical protein